MNVRQTTNILLIEDNPGDTHLVKIYMKDAAFKFELFVADTFFEGMDILSKHEVDIVLLDLSLPDSQGFKTLNRFIDTVSNIPVIVMTGVNNEIVGNQAVKAGAQDFLVKGQFDGKLLGRAIRYAIQRHKEFQKLEDTKRELTINERRIVKAQQLEFSGIIQAVSLRVCHLILVWCILKTKKMLICFLKKRQRMVNCTK
jgi:DNA-binding response OmpR family regulator